MNKALVASLMLLMAGAAAAADAVSPQDLFHEAELQETTARDLDAAVQRYRQVAAQPAADRNLQARAYLHIGLCEWKLGQSKAAEDAWKKIVQDYADQREPYAEALHQLQLAQAAEPPPSAPASTPTVKIEYRTVAPSTKWTVDFPQVSFLHPIDSKGQPGDFYGTKLFVDGQYFPVPRLGIGVQLGALADAGGTVNLNISQFVPYVAAQTRYWGPFSLYGKSGIGAYGYHFHNSSDDTDETHWRPGLMTEAGLVLGWYRGFTFNVGYTVHAVFQATPSDGFAARARSAFADAPGAASDDQLYQQHGLRFLGGPVVGLSFRW